MKFILFLKWLKGIYFSLRYRYPMKWQLGYCGSNCIIEYPCAMDSPQSIFCAENVTIRSGSAIINAPNEKVYIGKYTVLASGVSLVPNNHRATTTIPQFLATASHINDKSSDLHIGEDVWCGTRAVILSGADLGRGVIVGANSVVSKPVPPYAVVAGIPAKIIAVKFSIEQILEHEKELYPENERFSREYLESLFNEHFREKKIFGTSEGLDENNLEKLKEIKKLMNYIDWKNVQ